MPFYRLYSLKQLIQAYLTDNPTLSYDQAEALAIELRRELHRLDRNEFNNELRSQKLYGAGSVEIE